MFLKRNKKESGKKKFKQLHVERSFKAIFLGLVMMDGYFNQQPSNRVGISLYDTPLLGTAVMALSSITGIRWKESVSFMLSLCE